MKHARFLALFLLALGLAAAPCSRAATILTTYNGNDGGTSSGIASASGKAVGFTMPAGPDYILNSISLRLSATSLVSASNVTLAIYDNDGTNTPGTLLATMVTPDLSSLSSTPADYLFTTGSSFTLTSGTAYWVALTNSSTNVLSWRSSTPADSFSSPIGATYLGAVFGSSSNPSGWTSVSSVRNALTVDATAVPEPATGLLLALSLAALCARRSSIRTERCLIAAPLSCR